MIIYKIVGRNCSVINNQIQNSKA